MGDPGMIRRSTSVPCLSETCSHSTAEAAVAPMRATAAMSEVTTRSPSSRPSITPSPSRSQHARRTAPHECSLYFAWAVSFLYAPSASWPFASRPASIIGFGAASAARFPTWRLALLACALEARRSLDRLMVATRSTRGRILTGISATYYDIGNALFGVPLVIRKHVSLIRMKDGDSLLDVGCGTGAVLRRVQRAFGESTVLRGIDPSPDMLRVAARKLRGCPNARVVDGIGEGLSFPDNSFDWVVSCLTTHHLPLEAKRLMLGECHRVLRPAGRLLVSDFAP